MQISRRAILVATVLSVAACGKHPKPVPPAPLPAVNPDAAALLTAQNIERRLLATYQHEIQHAHAHRRPVLEVGLAMHTAHLQALHGSATAGPAATQVRHLAAALRSSAATLRGLSLAAVDGANAALFASIAASHETTAQ